MACMLSTVAKNKTKVDGANLDGLEMRILLDKCAPFFPQHFKNTCLVEEFLELQGSIDDIL